MLENTPWEWQEFKINKSWNDMQRKSYDNLWLHLPKKQVVWVTVSIQVRFNWHGILQILYVASPTPLVNEGFGLTANKHCTQHSHKFPYNMYM